MKYAASNDRQSALYDGHMHNNPWYEIVMQHLNRRYLILIIKGA